MCKFCEKKLEIKRGYKWTSPKHPHYHWVEEKVYEDPIWFDNYLEGERVVVYFDVDKKEINGDVKLKINFCPFCGRKL